MPGPRLVDIAPTPDAETVRRLLALLQPAPVGDQLAS